MNIQFRQQNAGYCSVYLLANIFNDDGFLKYLTDPKFIGCSNAEIDQMLSDMGTGLKVCQVLYASQHYSQLPKDYIYNTIKNFKELKAESFEIPLTFAALCRDGIWKYVVQDLHKVDR